MSEKEKEIEEEIKDTPIIDEEEAKIDEEVKPDITEVVKEEIEEVKTDDDKTLSDPFGDWTEVFSEFHKEIPEEISMEPKEWLSRDEIRMVAREEIKGWVKGIQEGKYPIPTGMVPKIEPKIEPKVDTFPEKEFKSLQDEVVEIKKSRDTMSTRFDEILKSLESMKKEIEVIRDTPIDIVEKSIVKKVQYVPNIQINSRDNSITRR